MGSEMCIRDSLQDAPIGHSLRDFMQVAQFSGDSDLHLKLDVPLSPPVLDKQGVAAVSYTHLTLPTIYSV